MPPKRSASSGHNLGDLFKQVLGAVKRKGAGQGTSGRESISEIMGGFSAMLKRKGEAAISEFKARIHQVRRSLPPMALRVVPESAQVWTREPEVRSRMDALVAAGFRELGTYRLDPIPDYVFVGYIHEGLAAQAQVARTCGHTVLELSSHYEDGTEFGSLDLTVKLAQSTAPWATSLRRPGMPPAELIRDFLKSRPKNGLVPTTPGNFASRIEDAFRRLQRWRAERGGFNSAELRQIHGLGDDRESVERVSMLRDDHAQRWLCQWLAAQPESGVTLADVLETLVIVYDEMPPDLVANAWWCGTGDFGARSKDFAGAKPLEVFRRMNQQRGEPLRLICRKPPPFAADFYLPKPRPKPDRNASVLVRAIDEGLSKNDLRVALFDLREYTIKSDSDAVAVCDVLRSLDPGTTPDFAKQLQAITRLFHQVPDLKSPAGVRLSRDGLPLLARRWDELRKLPRDLGSGSAALLILQTLARYETAEGTDKVISAARAGFERDGSGWIGVFNRYKPGHPQFQRLFAAFSDGPPPGDIGGHLLSHANNLLLGGTTLKHPFDSPAGRKRLLAWIRSSKPENSGAAHTATAAIPFLGPTGRRELLGAAARHRELGVRMEAAWAEAKLGRKSGLQRLAQFCRHWSSTTTAQQYLRELGREDLIPSSTRDPSFEALSQMSDWLAHPNEFGRVPDELEILDHRKLRWPPEGAKKPFWVIRYRFRGSKGGRSKGGDADDTGCGLVGSITFCLFSMNLVSRPPEDVYGVHCCWELEQQELLSEDDLDAESASKHAALLRQWRGDPLNQATLVRVAKLSRKLDYPRRAIGLVRATVKGRKGHAILDGDRSAWIPGPRLKKSEIESYGAMILHAHVGRGLLDL